MPKIIKRQDGVTFTIPDNAKSNTKLEKSFLDIIVSDLLIFLEETKQLELTTNVDSDPNNKVKRYYRHILNDEDKAFNESNKLGNPLLAKNFNYIISLLNKISFNFYNIENYMLGMDYEKNIITNETFKPKKNCKTIMIHLYSAAGGRKLNYDGEDSYFGDKEIIAVGGKGQNNDTLISSPFLFEKQDLQLDGGWCYDNGGNNKNVVTINYYDSTGTSENNFFFDNNLYSFVYPSYGEPSDCIFAAYNVDENKEYSINLGDTKNTQRYDDDRYDELAGIITARYKSASTGFCEIFFSENGDQEPYGFDKIYSKPGEYSFTVPGGLRKITVAVIGGGAIAITKNEKYSFTENTILEKDGESSYFGDIISEGAKCRDSLGNIIEKNIYTSGTNITLFDDYGSIGRGFINFITQKASNDSKKIIKVIDCYPGQQFKVKVGEGGILYFKNKKDNTQFRMKGNHGAVAIAYGDYSKKRDFSAALKKFFINDKLSVNSFNNIISFLNNINAFINDYYFETSDYDGHTFLKSFNKNNECQIGCQTRCQSGCQLFCQNCQYYMSVKTDGYTPSSNDVSVSGFGPGGIIDTTDGGDIDDHVKD